MAPLQEFLDSCAWDIVAPEITRIGRHFTRRFGRPFGAVSAANVDNSDAGRRRQQPGSFCRAKGILHIAQVANHGNLDVAPARLAVDRWFRSRLENDAKLVTKFFRNNAPGKTVQCNKAIREFHRAQGRRRILVYVVIDVSAAELDDERPLRIAKLKAAYRLGAAKRVNGDHRGGRLV